MNFDVRAYCERIAKANQERFSFESDGPIWLLYDGRFPVLSKSVSSADSAWQFIGPLADELGIGQVDMYWRCPMGCRQTDDDGNDLPPRFSGLLEATFAAVCEKLEEKR